jgi:5-methylcytosine-specific restriction endonuclease McrA
MPKQSIRSKEKLALLNITRLIFGFGQSSDKGQSFDAAKQWMADGSAGLMGYGLLLAFVKAHPMGADSAFLLASRTPKKSMRAAYLSMVPTGYGRVLPERHVQHAPVPTCDPVSDEFLKSYEWRRLRMVVLKKYGRRCQCCGASGSDGVTVIHVDHIKPRRQFPELALDVTNLQVLCEACNHGKGNWDETDWRGEVVLDKYLM